MTGEREGLEINACLVWPRRVVESSLRCLCLQLNSLEESRLRLESGQVPPQIAGGTRRKDLTQVGTYSVPISLRMYLKFLTQDKQRTVAGTDYHASTSTVRKTIHGHNAMQLLKQSVLVGTCRTSGNSFYIRYLPTVPACIHSLPRRDPTIPTIQDIGALLRLSKVGYLLQLHCIFSVLLQNQFVRG